MSDRFKWLTNQIGYEFEDESLVDLALTHRSFGPENNERLEFLGDSVLNFSVAALLFEKNSKWSEGDLSKRRASLVSKAPLAAIAQNLDLGGKIKMSSGTAQSGGRDRSSILADSVEAILGAVYLDSGFEAALGVVRRLYDDFDHLIIDKSKKIKDAKTSLQEFLQARKSNLPDYILAEIVGEPHDQTFLIECHIQAYNIKTIGEAKSRRAAEQIAAKEALELMRQTKKKPPKASGERKKTKK